MTSSSENTARARTALVVAFALVGLGLLLIAIGATTRWLTGVPAAGPAVPGSGSVALRGSTLVPAAVPLALLGAAGLAAVLAARGVVLRLLAAAVLLAAGLAVLVLTARVLADPAAAASRPEVARQNEVSAATDSSAGPFLALAGGLLQTAAGGVALVRGRRWPGLGRRYERPTPETTAVGRDPAETVPGPAGSEWDALERGEDPTAAIDRSAEVRRHPPAG